MKHKSLTIPRNGRLNNLIEEFIRNWRNDSTGLDRILRNGGEEDEKINKSNRTTHQASST